MSDATKIRSVVSSDRKAESRYPGRVRSPMLNRLGRQAWRCYKRARAPSPYCREWGT